MSIPNTFLVGAPKSGTTALVHYLESHPQIFFSRLKEPGYWASDFPWLASGNVLRSQSDYLELFGGATAHQLVVGEASTMYLCSGQAAQRILDFNPRARFLVMLRNPIEVAQAYHMQKLLMFHEDQADFEVAWRLQETRRRGHQVPTACPGPPMLQYGAIARFGAQVRGLLQTVPREAVLFIRYEELQADPGSVYRRTLAFLGLGDDLRADFPRIGPARQHRSPTLARLYLNPPAALRRPMGMLRRHLVRHRYPAVEMLKRKLFRNQPRPAISASLRAELAEHFTADVHELGRLLDWDLRHWLEPRAALE